MVGALVNHDIGPASIPNRGRIYVSDQYGSGVDPVSQKLRPDTFQNFSGTDWEDKVTNS